MTNQPTAAAEWDIAAMTTCATALRRDWDPAETTGALIAARHRGWTPCHALVILARMLADPDSNPRDLLNATRDPIQRTEPARPEIRELIAAGARAAITAPRPGRAA